MTNKKRASEGGASSAKRARKASGISLASGAGAGSAHPLRQTSFPPDDIGTPFSARSPSVDIDNISVVSGSQGRAGPGRPKGSGTKRGRKPKDAAREQTPSVVGTRGDAPASDAGGTQSAGKGAAGGDEGEASEDEGPTEAAVMTKLSKEQIEEQQRQRMLLINALAPHQFERFEAYRASGLTKAAVKKVPIPIKRCKPCMNF